MVLIRTKSTQSTTNGPVGEIINKFQDFNIDKNIKTLERKKEKLPNNKDSILYN